MENYSNRSWSEQFLRDFKKKTLQEVRNPEFGVADMADHLCVSIRTLYRVIKSQTGLSPKQFMRDIILESALVHIESLKYRTVSEVAASVGIKSTAYFSRVFREKYGVSPREMMNGLARNPRNTKASDNLADL